MDSKPLDPRPLSDVLEKYAPRSVSEDEAYTVDGPDRAHPLDRVQRERIHQHQAELYAQGVQDLQQNREQRKEFANKAFKYLWCVSIFVAVILLLEGVKPLPFSFTFSLPDIVLTVLVAGPFVSVVGLAGFVVKGLFGTSERPKT